MFSNPHGRNFVFFRNTPNTTCSFRNYEIIEVDIIDFSFLWFIYCNFKIRIHIVLIIFHYRNHIDIPINTIFFICVKWNTNFIIFCRNTIFRYGQFTRTNVCIRIIFLRFKFLIWIQFNFCCLKLICTTHAIRFRYDFYKSSCIYRIKITIYQITYIV